MANDFFIVIKINCHGGHCAVKNNDLYSTANRTVLYKTGAAQTGSLIGRWPLFLAGRRPEW